MAKKQNTCTCNCCHGHMALFGLGMFAFGLMLYLGAGWSVALMALGAIAFIKGLIVKMGCCK